MSKIDKTWTLFLDRDGVINTHLPNAYVLKQEEFKIINGVVEAIVVLSSIFGRIVVVTNQQGIGKGLMTEMDLEKIHFSLRETIAKAGGKIDAVYYCPHLSSIQCKCRKPNIGMAINAKNEFPEIEFEKSVMVGDSPSDMEFGNQLGMKCIQIYNPNSYEAKRPIVVDSTFNSLLEYSLSLKNI